MKFLGNSLEVYAKKRLGMRFIYLLAICVLSLQASACSKGVGSRKRSFVQHPLTTELLVEQSFSQVRDVVVLPVSGEPLKKQPEYVSKELNKLLIKSLSLETGLQVRNSIEPEKVQKAISKIAKGSPLSQAIEVAKELKPDGVFFTTVSKYNTDSRSQNPSEVGFRVWFLPRGSKHATWVATYEYSEKPLSENLFRLRQALQDGFRYQGALKLSERGFRALAKEFELLRLS